MNKKVMEQKRTLLLVDGIQDKKIILEAYQEKILIKESNYFKELFEKKNQLGENPQEITMNVPHAGVVVRILEEEFCSEKLNVQDCSMEIPLLQNEVTPCIDQERGRNKERERNMGSQVSDADVTINIMDEEFFVIKDYF